jgi:hypothetical protein
VPNPAQRTAAKLRPIKTRLLDAAIERVGLGSFADLGGAWQVHGGYSFYLLEAADVHDAFLVDGELNSATREQAVGFPQLELVEANFGSEEVRDRIGPVDLLVMFDVLLHQVDPDWDAILRLYAPSTRAFAIVNPQFIGADRTTRLLDLGREGYLAAVPDDRYTRETLDRMHELAPGHGRVYRDVFNIWQWGIIDSDLRAKMDALGFTLTYYENAGQWRSLEQFENCAYLFLKQE